MLGYLVTDSPPQDQVLFHPDDGSDPVLQDLHARGLARLCKCWRTVLRQFDGTFYCSGCREKLDD